MAANDYGTVGNPGLPVPPLSLKVCSGIEWLTSTPPSCDRLISVLTAIVEDNAGPKVIFISLSKNQRERASAGIQRIALGNFLATSYVDEHDSFSIPPYRRLTVERVRISKA